ncbi:hypothetical protein [Nannocystis pusilla]|uniref:hypothetical protein n=1 Tax=Nannocystis pusilla TaxID=889268 RepID=UPI003B81C81F
MWVAREEHGVTRMDITSLLRSTSELKRELERRTTACPDLTTWRTVSLDDERARMAVAHCNLRHGRGLASDECREPVAEPRR